ncbi:MAG: L-rhamnose mutarotase [Flavisolibacter sp.]
MSKRYCLALNLKNNPDLIREYEEHHQKVWPEVLASIKDSGIEQMEIYRLGTRLFMIMEVNDHFSFEKKAEMDRDNEKVQQWEELMWKYQQPLEEAAQGEKWMLLDKIFDLNEVDR